MSSSRAPLLAAGAIAVLFALAGSPAALAQKADPKATGPVDDMRPLYASSMDIAEGKRLAQGPCATCHGVEGVSTITGVPHLAGQRSPYLYREMRAYLSGARGNDVMNGTINFLSTDALVNVAAYYASQDPAPTLAAGDAKPEVDPVVAGKAIAAGCAPCHGEVGISKTPGMPSLVGMEPKYLVSAMEAYKNGQRKNDMMKMTLSAVPEASMNNVALFYALQKPTRAPTNGPGDPNIGQTLSTPCSSCHGSQGISGNASTPSLAGQDATYFAAAIRGYQDGSRADVTMKALVGALDDAAVKNLAAFYASLPPQAPNVRKPLSTAQWTERCDRCHGVNGNSTNPRYPALAGQRVEYLTRVLNLYRTGARHSLEMAAMAEVLSENDVKNIATYYSRQKAKAVVFVQMPPR